MRIDALFSSLSTPYKLAFLVFCLQKEKSFPMKYRRWATSWINNKNDARAESSCRKMIRNTNGLIHEIVYAAGCIAQSPSDIGVSLQSYISKCGKMDS